MEKFFVLVGATYVMALCFQMFCFVTANKGKAAEEEALEADLMMPQKV